MLVQNLLQASHYVLDLAALVNGHGTSAVVVGEASTEAVGSLEAPRQPVVGDVSD